VYIPADLLNLDLDQGDRAFQEGDVAEWLRNTEDTALSLYWSKARPRKYGSIPFRIA
jgi:hypothetical protein